MNYCGKAGGNLYNNMGRRQVRYLAKIDGS